MSRVTAALSIGLAAALSLSACSGEEIASAPTPTMTQSVLASVSPTPEATVAPVSTSNQNYSVAELKSMSPEEFSNLPNIDKGPYLKSLLSETDKRFSFFGGSDGKLYQFNPLDIASEDNTANEILRQINFEAQLIFAQTLNPNTPSDWTLDVNAAKKALSAQFYNTTDGNTLPLYKNKIASIDSGSTAHTYELEALQAEFIDGPTTIEGTDGTLMKSVTLQWDNDGEIYNTLAVYDKLDDETSIWKVYSDTIVG